MRHIVLLMIFLWFGNTVIGKSLGKNLEEALKNHLIAIDLTSKGGYAGACMNVHIQNISPKAIQIVQPAGLIIASEDSSSQQLVITQNIIANLQPNQKYQTTVNTFCVSPGKSAPVSNEKFSIKTHADVWLQQLLTLIVSHKVKSSDAQSAIWAHQQGRKEVYLPKSTYAKSFKEQFYKLYADRLLKGLILPDTSLYSANFQSFTLEGNYDWFVSESSFCKATLEDSLSVQSIDLLPEQNRPHGMIPLRYLHHYTAASEKSFFICLYQNGKLIERIKAKNDPNPQAYERIYLKSSAAFDLPQTTTAGLQVCDSAGYVFTDLFENRKLAADLHVFKYMFSLVKTKKQALYLVLKDANGTIISRQIASLSHTLKPLRGMIYVRFPKKCHANFGLYNRKGELIKLFETNTYNKGLVGLRYAFIFDPSSKEELFVRVLEEQTHAEIYAEKVYIK